MPDTFFDNPPILQGDEKTQIRQLYGYLGIMSSKLNDALMNITIEQMSPSTRQIIEKSEDNNAAKTEETLKALIIKTANIVRTEMDEIATQLRMETTALSDQFGEYERSLDSTIRATAEGVLQDYHYEERVTGLETEAGTTDGYIRRTNQYIFSGLIDEVNMEYGIAIGEGVTSYDGDGNPYLNSNAKCATFTMNRLSFWQGSVELAYFSGGKFYIANGEILNTLKIGAFTWKKMADDSLALIKG
jgi:hypothetical protein